MRLRAACSDLSWLLERGYSHKAALKLVGDRYSLTERQRLALARVACSEKERAERLKNLLPTSAIETEKILADGFNLIITMEAALSNGPLLLSRDGCIRDLSSVHGSYRSVHETNLAIRVLGEALMEHRPEQVTWLLDSPVSNSGRLASRIRNIAAHMGWNWDVELFFNPDKVLSTSDQIVATSDAIILSSGIKWINLVSEIVLSDRDNYWIIDLCN